MKIGNPTSGFRREVCGETRPVVVWETKEYTVACVDEWGERVVEIVGNTIKRQPDK